MRNAKELLIASREFAHEYRWLSWWHLWTTLGALLGLIAAAASDLPWGLRLASSVLAGLVTVRMFIIYHDYQHGAILRRSPFAGFLMGLYGLLTLNPPSVWNRSHDDHHRNNSKTFGASIGSFPTMTKQAYASATSGERLIYATARHPLTMVLGYFTVFLWRMSLRPFLLSPRRHFDGGLAVLANFGMVAFFSASGWGVLLLGLVVPMLVATSLGAYLFYAQHNYPAAQRQTRADWSHVDAALHSSSFIMMSPLMHWFTGNIGYHHVHHLNSRIPFYRLPEAMAALEELQSPGTTSLHPHDIQACLRLKLWSPEESRFVDFNGA